MFRVLVLQLRPRHRFRVAAEDDVGTTTGHVGGDRDGALLDPPERQCRLRAGAALRSRHRV